MKRVLSVLLLTASLLPVIMSFVSCTNFFFNTSNTPETPEDPTTETPTHPNNPDAPVNPDDGATETNKYSYTPYLPETMPEVRVDTVSGTANFATDITHINQKWNNEIQYEGCTVSVGECDAAYAMTDVSAEIKVRGNYTVMFPKQPFRIKFTEKQNMLGMNEGRTYKSWVLLAEWKDSSMLFDATAYYLGKNILGSDGYYCTDYRFVKLYLNDIYWGVYLLAEQQQTGAGRVDIYEPDPTYMGTDIGYFFEYDGYYDMEDVTKGGDYTFAIDHNSGAPFRDQAGDIVDTAYFRGYTIKSDINTETQRAYLEKYMDNLYTALWNTLFTDSLYIVDENGDADLALLHGIKTKRDAIEHMIDVDSLVDTYILNEICCDYDLHWSSFYMSLDLSTTGNQKLTFQAPWDFDTAFGSKDSARYMQTGTKYSNKDACETAETPYAGVNRNPWLLLLMNEEWFMDLVKEKWQEIVSHDIHTKALEQIDIVTERYEDALIENATRGWVVNKGTTTKPNMKTVYHVGDPTNELVRTIQICTTQAQASLRLWNWLSTRFNYLNTVWGDGTELV